MSAVGPVPPARTLAAAAAVATAGVLPAFLTGAVAVQVGDDLGFDAAGLGAAIAVHWVAAAVSSTRAGRLAERLGDRRAMRLAAVLSAVALAAVAVGARSYGLFVAFLAIGGVGNALAQPAANLFLAGHVPPGRLGLAFGVKQSAIPLATLLGGLAVPAIAIPFGWRWAFGLGALLSALLAVVDPGRAGGGHRPKRSSDGPADTGRRPLLLMALGVGLGASAAGPLGTFLVSGAVDAGLSEGSAGLLSSLCSVVGLVTRFTSGLRADRRGGAHLRAVARMLGVGALTYPLLASGRPGLVILGAPIAFSLAWGWPGLFQLAIVRANPTHPGAATGTTQTGTYIGAVLGPLAFGAVADRSYALAWLGAGVVSALAAVAVTVARKALLDERASRAAAEVPRDAGVT